MASRGKLITPPPPPEKRFWILTEFYNICPNPKNLCFAMSDGRCYIFLGFANISFITYIMGHRR